MPAPEIQDPWRGARLLTNGLFWAGVALAPLAALLLMFGQGGGPLRVAGVLAILAVVLIGLSITLRRSQDASSGTLEERIVDEVEALRSDVRQDIATAARATHRAFGEKLQRLYVDVQALRGQLDALRAEAAHNRAPQTQASYGTPAAGYGPAEPGYATAAPGYGTTYGSGAGGDPGYGAAPPAGRVRHTETVQVTTRQTIVDPLGGDPARGTVYGGSTGYATGDYPSRESPAASAQQASGEWPMPRRARRSAEPGQRVRADQRWSDQPWGNERPPEQTWSNQSWADERPPEQTWSGAQAGDRWASVRSDDRGSELHVGERRAAMHADDRGSEVRIQDRWAAVRREEPRREESRAERRPRHGSGEDAWTDARWDRALPAGGIEVTGPWVQAFTEPEREPVTESRGRRRAEDRYEDRYDGWR